MFRLAAAGDIIMTTGLKTRDIDVLGSVKSADLATANLEVVVSESRAAADKFICLRMSPEHIDDVQSLGFKVMCVANNHSLDFGVEGLRDTISTCKGAGMLPVGAGENIADSLRAEIVETGGKRVAFLAATTTLPNSSAAGPSSPGIAPVRVINRYRIDGVTINESPGMSPYVETEAVAGDVERLCAAVKASAEQADLVVVHLHWGVPLGWVAPTQDEIADYQRPLAHALVDMGADLIVGHHPHYVQGVEFYKNTPILYSLGNFLKHKIEAVGGRDGVHPPYKLSSLRGYWNKIGCLALLGWDGSAGRPTCAFEVVQLDEHGEPQRADRQTGEALADRLKNQCASWGTAVQLEQGADGRILISFT